MKTIKRSQHTVRESALTSCLFLACVLMMGCGEASIVPPVDAGGPGVDVGTPPVDTQGTDGAGTDTGIPPVDVGETDTSTDSGVDTTGLGCEGDAKDSGCPCDSNDECASSFCFITSDGKECAQLCDSTCPEGFDCSPVIQGGDPIFICVQRTLYYCMPCTTNSECIVPGFEGDDMCVSYGDEGSFCGLKCVPGACPAGSTCVDGQCKNDSGTCDCAPLFQSLASKTDCQVSNEFGVCGGQRQCGPAGLSDCDAAAPAFDTCDGLDNDCDGVFDEDCSYQIRGRMMGGGFVVAADPSFTLKGSTGTPRIVGTSQGDGFILRAGFPPK